MSKPKYDLSNYNLKSNRKINGWTLVSLLGKGGNGEVWKCRNDKKEEKAIKFLKWGRGLSYKRFFDEATFMSQYMGTMGIIPIEDKYIPEYSKRFSNLSIPFYYVMPLAEPIDKKLRKESLATKIEIIKDLLHNLTELHSKGIAHRDIKPANILYYNNQYVLSDFGLVFFPHKTAKTPPGSKLGAKSTISPQMERDSVNADKYKSDVYSMAKTIWMILTDDMTSFDGQYQTNNAISLNQLIKDKTIYWYPLEKLLVQCTDLNEAARPTADELEVGFNDWLLINESWDRKNLIQWQEVQELLFPFYIPSHSEWTALEDIVSVLNLVSKYDNLNHLFFPDGGGLDLNYSCMSYESDCIELHFGSLIYIVKPRKLHYEFIDNGCEWNYFLLELVDLSAITPNYPSDVYAEEFYETAPAQYKQVEELEQLTTDEFKSINPRRIIRYLKGNMVIFHKNSIYNQLISSYQGEHSHYTIEAYRHIIEKFSIQFKGQTMASIIESLKQSK